MKITNFATDSWYSGKIEYDFKAAKPKNSKDVAKKRDSDEFTRMIWKSSTTVGFGIHKNRSVVAWYCAKAGNLPDNTKAFSENVNDVCIVNGYNKCYNDMALKYHN